MTKPLVSVIIPVKNRANIIERAINSVSSQTYSNVELIIIDDGSDDDIQEKVEQIQKKVAFPIHFIRQRNTGPGLARRNGLKASKGKYIQYLDSDDELLPNKLESQVKVLEGNPDVTMVYGQSIQNWDYNNVHRKSFKKNKNDDLIKCALQKRKWHTSACLWNYRKVGDYWDDLRNGEDVLHDVTVGIQVGHKIMFIEEFVCNINFDSNDVSHLSNAGQNKDKHRQIVENASKLNYLAYERLVAAGLDKKEYVEPLVERYFYEGLKFAKLNFTKESKEMLERGVKITRSTLKKVEFYLALIVIKYFKNNLRLIKTLFKIHTILLPPEVHQFRRIA